MKTGAGSFFELTDMGENAEIFYRPFKTLSPGERAKVILEIPFSGQTGIVGENQQM